MLVFAESAQHILVSLFIFLVGLSIALKQKRFFKVSQKQAIALYLWHSFFCIAFFWFSLGGKADATGYYLHSLEYDSGFHFGTRGVYFVVSFLSQNLSLSYGNVCLVFNIFGYIGLLAFASALRSVTLHSRPDIKKFSAVFPYLPGLSFWSSSVGKDALTGMAAGLVTWAALDLRHRLPAVFLGAFLFFFTRPHMAGILLLSFCLALLVTSQLSVTRKFMVLLIVVPITVFGVQLGLTYAGIGDALKSNAISQFLEARQTQNLGGGNSIDIASMSLPERLLSYMFRPLFFDAAGALGLLVSLENMALLTLFVAVSFRMRRTKTVLGSFEFYLFVFFVLGSWLVLANTTSNLGIAIRQKTMFLPMLITLLFSMWHANRKTPTYLRS
ncbi:hypothetical protein WG622_17625 [Cognatishimia sp. D5M38]|uniref:Oligosaccharide repeat unit polymerase n=1 Tax=Cognatishimia coralii TaxID=3083254 RepID=A0ABU8QKZ8_9RHOB